MKTLHVTLETITGLHIGAGQESSEIGGLDAPVIRDPINGYPYIPGSSIKGRMRCLIELRDGKFTAEGKPCQCGECTICRVFGHLHSNKESQTGPTRLMVRDAFLTDDSKDKYDSIIARGASPTEVKTEIQIDRTTGTSKSGLRTQERVPPGFYFGFDIVYRDFLARDDQERTEDLQAITDALELLQADALGKSGSRGYGQVKLTYDRDSFMA